MVNKEGRTEKSHLDHPERQTIKLICVATLGNHTAHVKSIRKIRPSIATPGEEKSLEIDKRDMLIIKEMKFVDIAFHKYRDRLINANKRTRLNLCKRLFKLFTRKKLSLAKRN
jgi:hypothetical protein